jgi:hypothetical protein
VILVVLVVGGLVDGIATLHYGGRLRAKLAALKSAGKPLAGSDLAPPPVPARENAAPLYLEAAEIIARHSGQGSAPTTMPAGPVPADEVGYGAYNWDDPGNLARLAGFVERDRRALDLVREASSRPAAAFDVDWTDPLTASLAHLAKLRSVARFLAAAAIVASHEGRQTEALERLRMGFVLARRPSAEPSMVAHLVSYAIHAMLTAAAEYVLAHGPLPEAEARRLAEELGRLDYRREFVQAVEGERVFGLALFEIMRRRRDSAGLLGNPEASVRVRLLAWGYRFPLRPLLDADELRYLAWMERHARLSALSPTERAAALAHPWTDDARPAPSWAVVTNTANAALARFAARTEFSRTQRQLLQAALGLGIYRQRHESYPGGLEEVRRIGWPVP